MSWDRSKRCVSGRGRPGELALRNLACSSWPGDGLAGLPQEIKGGLGLIEKNKILT